MASIVLNMGMAVASVAAWLYILVGASRDRTLAERGAGSLKYYTVLSNLLNAVACAAYALCLLWGSVPPAIVCLKLASTATVAITFWVTALLLRPIYGTRSLYVGGNFWLHLVLPLLAALDVCCFVPVSELPLWSVCLAAVPTALYAVWYVAMIRTHGAEENGTVYDFYGFLRWGEDKIGLILITMLAITCGIALLLRLASGIV